MSLVLSVLNGPLSGRTFALTDGLTIGRHDADVALGDRRVSTLHAYVRGTDEGGWILLDNASKNGIRDARGNLTDALTLTPDCQFQIGETNFRVALVEERREATEADISPPAEPAAAAPAAPRANARPAPAPKRYWYEVLADFIENQSDKFRDRPRGLTPLEPALVLDFTRGPQVNAKWILGYGPRKVGPAALDLPLWGQDLPGVCFEIVPSHDGLVFKTAHRDLVRLNNRAIDADVLRMGDVIHIGETLIEVDFAE